MTVVLSLQYVAAQFAGAILAGAINLLVFNPTLAAFERANNITRGSLASVKTAAAFGE